MNIAWTFQKRGTKNTQQSSLFCGAAPGTSDRVFPVTTFSNFVVVTGIERGYGEGDHEEGHAIAAGIFYYGCLSTEICGEMLTFSDKCIHLAT